MALRGSVAWITGAGSGIGLAGARELAAAGAKVVLSGRRAETLEREAAAIRSAGGEADAAPLDVGDAAAVASVTKSILARHGRIDVLVNSAGLNNPIRYWRDQTVPSWDEVIRINLSGTF
jgi:NAD(P)-dependent dehydrogenase (short-subunit alcohol dehydrogenase family)